jgi:isoleucyl-tRNA synthetase
VKAEELVRKCRGWYEKMSFHSVYRAVYDFAVTDLSAVYFDILKDRLYTTAPRSRARRSGQTAIYRLHLALVRLLAPLLTFTCEEVWGHTRHLPGSPESVHLAYFPSREELTEGLTGDQKPDLPTWGKLMDVRNTVLKRLDDAREQKVIGSSLEAAVQLEASGEVYEVLNSYRLQLPSLFIVSQVGLSPNQSAEPLSVRVERAIGDKCERCWKYTLDVGSDAAFPTICAACASALKESLS